MKSHRKPVHRKYVSSPRPGGRPVMTALTEEDLMAVYRAFGFVVRPSEMFDIAHKTELQRVSE